MTATDPKRSIKADRLFRKPCDDRSSYSLWSMRDCPQTAHDCVGWSLLGGAMFLPPGILVTTAAALSYAWRRAPFALVQSLLIGTLIAYYFLMGFE